VRSVPIRSDPPVRGVLAYTVAVILAVVGLLPLLAISGVLTMIGDMFAWAAHNRPVTAALAALLVLVVATVGFAVRRQRRSMRRGKRGRGGDRGTTNRAGRRTPADPPGDVSSGRIAGRRPVADTKLISAPKSRCLPTTPD
jgi:hypothetical protein